MCACAAQLLVGLSDAFALSKGSHAFGPPTIFWELHAMAKSFGGFLPHCMAEAMCVSMQYAKQRAAYNGAKPPPGAAPGPYLRLRDICGALNMLDITDKFAVDSLADAHSFDHATPGAGAVARSMQPPPPFRTSIELRAALDKATLGLSTLVLGIEGMVIAGGAVQRLLVQSW